MSDQRPDSQQRVIDEKLELDERRTKLGAFLETQVFRDLPLRSRQLLLMQDEAMLRYSEALEGRIYLFDHPEGAAHG